MAKKKLPDLQITELFLVKAGRDRTFMAEIRRDTSQDGKSIICGTVVVDQGRIWSAAETEEELANYLDDLCSIKLDNGLHYQSGVTEKISDIEFNYN